MSANQGLSRNDGVMHIAQCAPYNVGIAPIDTA